jgi:hypothetical protein
MYFNQNIFISQETQTMQNIITLDVLSVVSENGFSLDELVLKTKQLFEKEGLADFVTVILRLVGERICMDMIRGKRPNKHPCCDQPRYEYQNQLDRQFRTSVGTVKVFWRRLKCSRCGRNIIPLRQFLGISGLPRVIATAMALAIKDGHRPDLVQTGMKPKISIIVVNCGGWRGKPRIQSPISKTVFGG